MDEHFGVEEGRLTGNGGHLHLHLPCGVNQVFLKMGYPQPVFKN